MGKEARLLPKTEKEMGLGCKGDQFWSLRPTFKPTPCDSGVENNLFFDTNIGHSHGQLVTLKGTFLV